MFDVASNHDTNGVLGPLEADVMAIMWAAEQPLTVRDVLVAINDRRDPELAYTTVMTVLVRLADKQILTREREGKGFRYQAAVGDHAGIAVREVVRDFGEAAIAGFVDEARSDPKLLRRLRAMLDDDQ